MASAAGSKVTGLLARRLETTFTQLQTALRREQAFARDVSHELRTPLTLMRNTLALADARLLLAQEQLQLRHGVDKISNTVELLFAMVRAGQVATGTVGLPGHPQYLAGWPNCILSLLLLAATCMSAVAQVQTLQHKETKRRYIVCAPPGYDSRPQQAFPVVFNFHGGGMTLCEQTLYTQMKPVVAHHQDPGSVGMLLIHGTLDQVVQYEGNATGYLSAEASLRYWANVNGMTAAVPSARLLPVVTGDPTQTSRQELGNGTQTVALITVGEGGHTWCGADAFNIGLPIGKTIRLSMRTRRYESFSAGITADQLHARMAPFDQVHERRAQWQYQQQGSWQ